MAEGSLCEGKSLEELERDITCAICQEHYTEPKVLPCLHYYCKQCILKLAVKTGTGKPFSCPECRSEAILPEGGVDEFKTAFFVYRLKSAYTTVEQVQGKVEVKCEACTSENKADSFCRQCAVFICTTCVESHQRMRKMFEGHEVVSIQDLKEGRAKADITLKETATAMKCKVHKKSLKLYCFDCNLLICQHCMLKDHRDHNFDFNTITAPNIKQELMELLEPLKKESNSLSEAVGKVQNAKHEVEAQGTYLTDTIRTSFDELLENVKKFKEELILKAEQKVQTKMENLSEQEKNLSLAHTEVKSVVDYTERCVRHCDDNEVMSMHAEVKSRIERETNEHCKSRRSMEPVDEADMGVEVRCADALHQLHKTTITQLAVNPAQSTVKGEGAKIAEVHKTAEVTMTAKLTNHKRNTVIFGQLKSLYDGSVIKCDVQQLEAEKYCLKYTPTVRGCHELTVTVDGQHVADSPFPVFVSISPTELGKPVKVLDGLPKVVNVVINSQDEIIVLKQDDDMLSFYKDWKKLRSSSREDLQLNDCYVVGLDIDKEDNIYMTATNFSVIVKLDKDGHVIKKAKLEETTRCHYDVTVLEEEVMVCSYSSIVVYDRELNYVRKIVGEGMGELLYISTDSCSNIYATDRDRRCVQVFSHRGNFLRSLKSDDNGVDIFTWPLGVCVRDQFVYVANDWGDDNHNISVFTTDGKYVTTFGKKGHFNGPRGICLDKHGFVHVCDKLNDRIQIF